MPDNVNVSDVESLYAAVNDPGNAGKTIVLAPGTYRLTRLNPLGVPRLNGGRLELQANMSMAGGGLPDFSGGLSVVGGSASGGNLR